MTNQTPKLVKKHLISGKIELLSGMHIGGSKNTLEIGGLDAPVIKTPHGVPYIPGSSLKGKLRSLLARKEGSESVEADSGALKKIFGTTEKGNGFSVTRCIFRDAMLDEAHFAKCFENKVLETAYTEEKYENTIDRLEGKANNMRQMERVPVGAQFDFHVVFDQYDDGKKENDKLLKKLQEGFALLEKDYLGGSGTRGYGRVKFHFDVSIESIIEEL